MKSSDAKDFYDTPAVKRATFEMDWAVATRKYALDKKLATQVKKLSPQAAAVSTFEDLKEAVFAHFDVFYCMFSHYSSMSMQDIFSVGQKEFEMMLQDCRLAESIAEKSEMNLLWIDTNTKAKKDEEFNKKHSATREEWLAIFVRICITRYVTGEQGVRDAFAKLAQTLVERQSPMVFHDANSFRADYCYTESTDMVLRIFEKSLRMLYEVVAAGHGGVSTQLQSNKLLDIEEFRPLIKKLDLIDEFIYMRTCDRAFLLSRMLVKDESSVKGRAKLTQLRFEDFLEVLVRLAYVKAMPTDEEINESDCEHAGEYLVQLQETNPAAYNSLCKSRTREFGETLEQPFWRKVYHFLSWFMYIVRDGVNGKKELSEKEAKAFMAKRGGGKGGVGGVSLAPADQPPAPPGMLVRQATMKNVFADIDSDVSYIRSEGGPARLAEDDAMRSSIRQGAE